MSRRATQRSRSRNAPSRASTSVASQHAATFQSPVELPLRISMELHEDEVLQWTYQSFMETMQALHQESTHTRPCLDRSRIQEMQRNTLSTTMNTLHHNVSNTNRCTKPVAMTTNQTKMTTSVKRNQKCQKMYQITNSVKQCPKLSKHFYTC